MMSLTADVADRIVVWTVALARASNSLRIVALIAITSVPGAAGEPQAPPNAGAAQSRAAVQFVGRIVDDGTGKPIPGATIVVSRVDIAPIPDNPVPAGVGDATLVADADGRFLVEIPADDAVRRHMAIHLTVSHPQFITITSRLHAPTPVATLIAERSAGYRPFIDEIRLRTGTACSGRLFTAEGRAAAGVWYRLLTPVTRFRNDQRLLPMCTGFTDAAGGFAFRVERLNVPPIAFEPDGQPTLAKRGFQVRTDEDSRVTDWGQLRLESRRPIKGRLLDLGGRPIAGQKIVVAGRASHARAGITDEAGEFSIPVPTTLPEILEIYAEEQNQPQLFDEAAAARRMISRDTTERAFLRAGRPAIRPTRRLYRPEGAPLAVELREIPSVEIEARVSDSAGRPAAGHVLNIWGSLPSRQEIAVAQGLPPPPSNDQDELDGWAEWGCLVASDLSGHARVSVPKRLYNVRIAVKDIPDVAVYAIRLVRNGKWRSQGNRVINDVNKDRSDIEVIAYRPATVLATIRTEDGNVAFDGSAEAISYAGGEPDTTQVLPDDRGRYRFSHLLPDRDYDFVGRVQGQVPNTVERRRLAEGSTTEITLIVRNAPKGPLVGELAPAFAVRALDGTMLSLANLQGKYVLLYLWLPDLRSERLDAEHLKQIYDRFGSDERFAMMSIGTAIDIERAGKEVDRINLKWPHALLPHRLNDPVAINYGMESALGSILIGPDGKIIAVGLLGEEMVRAVTDALARK
jgi:hypothetical protein